MLGACGGISGSEHPVVPVAVVGAGGDQGRAGAGGWRVDQAGPGGTRG